jgi:hypothetical protein
MTRLEKCELLKSKGYTYDVETGKVFGVRGKELITKDIKGYSLINMRPSPLKSHHFAWYITYGNVEFEQLDHINRNRSDNRICNLRITNHSTNQFNRNNTKGYSWHIRNKKWYSSIKINNKQIWLGSFDNEDDARQSYLNAKEQYHTQ